MGIMKLHSQNLDWQVGWADSAETTPETFVPAVVPGAVQLDWATAHNWPEHWVGNHCNEYGWMEDKFWLYRATLPELDLDAGQRVFLTGGGIDYQWEIHFGGQRLLAHEGMFLPIDLEITRAYRNGARDLQILVYPVPKARRENRYGREEHPSGGFGRFRGDQTFKPNMGYGTDFHPRIAPLGIWQNFSVEVRPAQFLSSVHCHYDLTADFKAADLTISAGINGILEGTGAIRWELLDPQGQVVLQNEQAVSADSDAPNVIEATLEKPTLWWPHGLGEQARYTLRVRLLSADGSSLDSSEQKIGFRRIRLTMEGSDFNVNKDGKNIPKSVPTPPVHFEINGRTTFIRGSNWINPDVFPGAIPEERYRSLLELVKGAHLQMLRCWGGAPVNHDVFYETCDEMGILVWQEFPMSIGVYWGTPEFLQVVESEGRAIIERLRHHPCIALWCGGNELFFPISWSNMQNPTFRRLDALCQELDPGTPWIPTSPIWGMGHGSYVFREKDGRDILQYFIDADCTAYPEFGSAGAATLETIRKIIPEEELWPPKDGSAWQTHKALSAWNGKTFDAWLCLPIIEHYFGEQDGLEAMLEKSHWLQSLGLQTAYEEARRQHEAPRGKPKCAMALCWCFNEPWPTAANNAIVSWPDSPKPAYQAVKAANRPTMLSARIPRFDWKREDVLPVELWFLNDSDEAFEPGVFTVRIHSGDRLLHEQNGSFPPAPPNRHLQGPTLRFALDEAAPGPLKVEIISATDDTWNSSYRLLLRD